MQNFYSNIKYVYMKYILPLGKSKLFVNYFSLMFFHILCNVFCYIYRIFQKKLMKTFIAYDTPCLFSVVQTIEYSYFIVVMSQQILTFYYITHLFICDTDQEKRMNNQTTKCCYYLSITLHSCFLSNCTLHMIVILILQRILRFPILLHIIYYSGYRYFYTAENKGWLYCQYW